MPNYYINPSFKRFNALKIHALCWSVYVFYEVIVAGIITGHFSNPVYYLLYYTLNISLFYAHERLVLQPSLGKPGSTWKLPFFLVFELVIYLALSIMIALVLETLKIRRLPTVFNGAFFIASLYRAFLFMIFSTGYYFLTTYILRKNAELKGFLENEQLRAELVTLQRDFLRSQINPHLLFNTLSFIKNSSIRNPAEAEEAILILSEIMSFAMERDVEGCVSLSKELKQVENIIQLNQLRYAHRLNIALHVNLHQDFVLTVSIVLLTLTENIFKHGNLLDPAFPAVIEVTSTSEKIRYFTRNLIGNQMKEHSNKEGTGLSNLKQRLDIQFRENYFFKIDKNGSFFEIVIEFPIQNQLEYVNLKD
ncbi:sensor histidine kinase [Pedobacter rhodius]|uniref:Histidine kinase n=1 Tax=Pedobacter rhodius TaxID=3004098 RepID=A0ABT4KVG4_9SPHI|nr:sensor histidine kinase [Pedobacter sp. SJ11]MCZ4222922.1 histidine kinase [Pedobacter sp. SJ11]